ncbi:spore germination protein [Tumebacillus permanentifrigoris]|uniref:GerA spore germination protein n=1 Tax=Tumebacillus permanentifrigoris TaxID=378543 RepID=A0A316D931_9BACL|nr:spore germination protein [Tumebacillus permanentifrigoris]PWK07861.1 GerA spore germination protein [Tumebacillus permanentifrigoris]
MEHTHLPASLDAAVKQVKQALPISADLVVRTLHKRRMGVLFVNTLLDTELLQRAVLAPLQRLGGHAQTLQALMEIIPIASLKVTDNLQQTLEFLLRGWVYLHLDGIAQGLLIQTDQSPQGVIPEREYAVIGQQTAFTESLENNVALIRKLLPDTRLCNESLTVGRRSKTRVSMLYISDIADEQNVITLRQRMEDLEVDSVIASSILTQLIDDNSWTVFTQMLLTERPDRVTYDLLEGKIALLLDGNSLAILAPCTLWDYMKTSEDYNTRWNLTMLIRAMRIVAMFGSTLMTALYVAALTYHYQVIPINLLDSLIESRLRVPFPPLYEALLLEVIIELLREAGARLPTKVGQTMGIVGGIVIGEAAVQAGFTSNILIMLVALGALSSFTSPNYMFGIVIRLLRFPMILLAGWLGGLGILLGIAFLMLHLLRITSLGHPFLWPMYPLRLRNWKEGLLRLRLPSYAKRSDFTRPEDAERYSPAQAKQIHDIDE